MTTINAMPTTIGGLTAEGFKYWEDRASKMTDGEIAWHIADLKSTIDIQEDMARNGGDCPKLGEYWDQLHTLANERRNRANGGR